MNVNIPLKNSSKVVILDEKVYEQLIKDPEVQRLDLLNQLREHSSGCAVYQKTRKLKPKEYETQTIYFHRYIADRFLKTSSSDENNLVGTKNGDKLDCRLSNLVWRSRSLASRMRKSNNKTGFTGVYAENKRYRAIISIDGKAVHIGMFNTAKEAALAYNIKAKEVFGERARINAV